jgi:hypothetical protein
MGRIERAAFVCPLGDICMLEVEGYEQKTREGALRTIRGWELGGQNNICPGFLWPPKYQKIISNRVFTKMFYFTESFTFAQNHFGREENASTKADRGMPSIRHLPCLFGKNL